MISNGKQLKQISKGEGGDNHLGSSSWRDTPAMEDTLQQGNSYLEGDRDYAFNQSRRQSDDYEQVLSTTKHEGNTEYQEENSYPQDGGRQKIQSNDGEMEEIVDWQEEQGQRVNQKDFSGQQGGEQWQDHDEREIGGQLMEKERKIVDEISMIPFYSKDASYVYSKESSAEKQAKENNSHSNGGIMSYNSYQQRHRLLDGSGRNDIKELRESQEEEEQEDNDDQEEFKQQEYVLTDRESIQGRQKDDAERQETFEKDQENQSFYDENKDIHQRQIYDTQALVMQLEEKDVSIQTMSKLVVELQEALSENQEQLKKMMKVSEKKSGMTEIELIQQIQELNQIISELKRKNVSLLEQSKRRDDQQIEPYSELIEINEKLTRDKERVLRENERLVIEKNIIIDDNYRLIEMNERIQAENKKFLESEVEKNEGEAAGKRRKLITNNNKINNNNNSSGLSSVNYDNYNDLDNQKIKYEMEGLQNERQELIRINKELRRANTELLEEIQDLEMNTDKKLERQKFELMKHFEDQLNTKTQEIHYRSHLQIQKYKELLSFKNQTQQQTEIKESSPFKQTKQINQVQGKSQAQKYTQELGYDERDDLEEKRTEKVILNQLVTLLKSPNILSISTQVAEIIEDNKIKTKFADCIVNMVQTCSQSASKPRSQEQQMPSLKYAWKWLKNIIEDYMQLKGTPNSSFEKIICEMLGVKHKMDAYQVLEDQIRLCRNAERTRKKISLFLGLEDFPTFEKFEHAIDGLLQQSLDSSQFQ